MQNSPQHPLKRRQNTQLNNPTHQPPQQPHMRQQPAHLAHNQKQQQRRRQDAQRERGRDLRAEDGDEEGCQVRGGDGVGLETVVGWLEREEEDGEGAEDEGEGEGRGGL